MLLTQKTSFDFLYASVDCHTQRGGCPNREDTEMLPENATLEKNINSALLKASK